MMLSMIFVMVTMSTASAERICEVLNEKADLVNPDNPDFEIPDGSKSMDLSQGLEGSTMRRRYPYGF